MTNYSAFAQNPIDRDRSRNGLEINAIRSFLGDVQNPERGRQGHSARGGVASAVGSMIGKLLH